MILAHCPKTGGTLLREILKSELSPRGHAVEGSEACYRYARTAGAFHVSALRSPRAHVLSQFYHCRLSEDHEYARSKIPKTIEEWVAAWAQSTPADSAALAAAPVCLQVS